MSAKCLRTDLVAHCQDVIKESVACYQNSRCMFPPFCMLCHAVKIQAELNLLMKFEIKFNNAFITPFDTK